MTKTAHHTLDQIKILVEDENLSFLIGAGFGKNISTAYPLWKELLADAIWEMFGTGKDSDRRRKEKTLADRVIREIGLLGVASKIVADAGFHEAVDDYIELHTPFLDLAGDGSVVLKKAGKELEEMVSLECHQLLRQLNIRNIYTFNYDNALEFCLGDKRALSKERDEIKIELEKIKQARENLQAEYLLFLQETDRVKIGLSGLTSGGDRSANGVENAEELKNKDSLEQVIDRYRERLKEVDAKVFSLNGKLGEVQKKLDESYLVITKSSDITQTDGGRNIYKIHGSLRLSHEEQYGFDGDKHAQYIITREDYENYEQKHGAFVNLMRIDLLRKRFCILGVSGGDANFLAWIGWVKDVLDKTGNEEDSQQNHSFFIYSGNDDLGRDMVQMLENHFITPVILKDCFPEANNETERVTSFLEYIQPRINNTTKMLKLWKDVDRRILEPDKSFTMEGDVLTQLCELSKSNVFFKSSSAVHFAAVGLENSANLYLDDADENKLKVIIAAVRCSLLPVRPSLLTKMIAVMKKSRDAYIKDGLNFVMRRHKLLYSPQSLKKTVMGDDVYTSILKRLYLFDFPSEKECDFECKSGLDFVRLFSLQRLLFGTSKVDLGKREIVSLFSSPQELVLANDWLYWLSRDIEGPIREAAKIYRSKFGIYRLSDYIESYLKGMRERKNPVAYGNVTETIYLGGRALGYENAAVLLNSIIELGVTFAGQTVLSDNDWIDVVHQLMPYHPFPLVFYTISRGGKEAVIKRVAQELIYDNRSYHLATVILNRILSTLCSKNVPAMFIEPMAHFAKYLFAAVPVAKWNKTFKGKISLCLDYADKKASYNAQKALYGMVSSGLNYIRDKKVKLVILKRVLESKIDERTDYLLNALAISAKEGISAKDFAPLSKLLVAFAQKKKGRLQSYILINLSSLLVREDLLKVRDVLELQAMRDCQLVLPYTYLVKGMRDRATLFRAKMAERKDVWQSGITESGSRMGGEHVKVSKVDKILHFNDAQVLHIWDDMVEILKKVNDKLTNSRSSLVDQGMLSFENSYREMVMDMQLFVHGHSDLLQQKPNYKTIVDDLEQTYYRCCFNKTILQMISDDEIYRAIRGMMMRMEMGGLESLAAEYKALVSCLLTKESDSINHLFLHLSWVMKEHKVFFEQNDFLALFMAILDSYAGYFVDNEHQVRWDICGCEKEIAEKCLMIIAKVLNEWGFVHPFWSNYNRKFFVKS